MVRLIKPAVHEPLLSERSLFERHGCSGEHASAKVGCLPRVRRKRRKLVVKKQDWQRSVPCRHGRLASVLGRSVDYHMLEVDRSMFVAVWDF